MKPITRRTAVRAIALFALVALLLGSFQAAGGATSKARGAGIRATGVVGPGIRKTSKRIAPGLIFTRFVDKKIPRRTFELVADLSTPITFDVTLADLALPSRATVSRMAKRNGALAAINGDFTAPGAGHPVHPFAQDGDLLQTVTQLGSVFAVSQDEQTVSLVRPVPSVTAAANDGRIFRLARWNQGDPALGEIAGYSPVGGTLDAPPDHACSVRLLPAGPGTFSSDAGGGIDRPYTVDVTACQEDPLPRNGGVVLAAQPATPEATQLLTLSPGTQMTLHWSVGLSGVLDVMGGVPQLVTDGQISVDRACRTGLCAPNPRTGIGVRADGKVILVVVDGRQKRWSHGVTLFTFARIMRNLGAVQALNLDGGGSSTMVVQGEVVNRPSEGHERAISNAVLILPGPDPGES